MNLLLISNSINGLVCLAIFLKIFSVWRTHRSERSGEMLWDFAMAYLMFTAYFAAIVIPQALLPDPTAVARSSAFTHSFLALSIGFFLMTVADIYGRRELRSTIFVSALLIAIAVVAVAFAFLKPNIVRIHQGFVFQVGDFPLFLRLFDGLVTVGGALFIVFFFLRHSRRAREPLVRRRSFLIGLGMFMLVVGAILVFFLGTTGSAIVIFLGSLTVIPGLVLILYGLLYRYRELPRERETGEAVQ